MTTLIQPEYIDRKTASARFSVPVSTLATMATRGGGPPFIKRGASVLYKVSDFVAWLEAGRKIPAETLIAQNSKPWEKRA